MRASSKVGLRLRPVRNTLDDYMIILTAHCAKWQNMSSLLHEQTEHSFSPTDNRIGNPSPSVTRSHFTMPTDALLYEEAAKYVSWDPNEETKAQMISFIETKNVVELRAALNSRLAFGTAGLRGAMGPGYNKMNDLVILQTTQGIAKYLIDQLGPDAKKKVNYF